MAKDLVDWQNFSKTYGMRNGERGRKRETDTEKFPLLWFSRRMKVEREGKCVLKEEKRARGAIQCI